MLAICLNGCFSGCGYPFGVDAVNTSSLQPLVARCSVIVNTRIDPEGCAAGVDLEGTRPLKDVQCWGEPETCHGMVRASFDVSCSRRLYVELVSSDWAFIIFRHNLHGRHRIFDLITTLRTVLSKKEREERRKQIMFSQEAPAC